MAGPGEQASKQANLPKNYDVTPSSIEAPVHIVPDKVRDMILPPNSKPNSLTNFLLNASPQGFNLATQHPFLQHAGKGTLPKTTLSRWLSQDRLYAQSYIAFIGALIARVDLPYEKVSHKPNSLQWRIVNLLSSSLENIHRELAFFDDTAGKYGLQLDAPSDPDTTFHPVLATEQYIEIFRSFGKDPSKSLLEGMVVLWATEACYLSAWTYASSFSTERGDDKPSSSDLDGGALREAFIPNWTSSEFQSFVKEIAALTDLLGEQECVEGRELNLFGWLWLHILDTERRFWPEV
ncbi:hypothetical protein LTR10_022289 [Elasticomyces elasticus]|uniref:Thiaminase-2/PQQC domain-containing protein n=1 Tax=Exophiala sideris TaxID=1016849 RepID=A0ABR0J217_9EURO|nr:hypothetical protein LTR10_022289 [Elasticomyces elasticus]KAK5024053.1 hypothetical protein LTS07_008787 [Exophiala sideris]KAK5029086.1 hypothetical protein LTR13_008957 [Exophiala sideris]KAK5054765.1 hypothetical protein LTR69_008672 [Exophiala sideris]KAK5178909.1 hypothetical protein LTR44_008738 [Eurotiomycetes sp. CCFEE 6388]